MYSQIYNTKLYKALTRIGKRHFLVEEVEEEEEEDGGGEGVVSESSETFLHSPVCAVVDPNGGRPSSFLRQVSVIT